MFIQKLRLEQFRCFAQKVFSFEKPFVLIEGGNGSGKTSILEALHYGCFLKSFRTSRTKDLISFDKKHFFLQVHFEEAAGDSNQVQIGLSFEGNTQKRLVRFNKKAIQSYKELISHYRIVSLAEEDLLLVQGAPEVRRYFLNQLVILFAPDFLTFLKKYRQILEQRNKMLLHVHNQEALTKGDFIVWTKQLWETAAIIQKERITHLEELEERVNELLKTYFSPLQFTVAFTYMKKNMDTHKTVATFLTHYKKTLLLEEYRWRRSLFGVHLDDVSIVLQEKKARHFASRGQQKLVVFLIKVALAQKLEEQGMKTCLLLDDFLTDLDHERLSDCLTLLTKLSCQVFVTCPLKSHILSHYKDNGENVQVISL